MYIKKPHGSERGDMVAVLVVLLSLALVCTLGFIYWQNFIQHKHAENNVSINNSILPQDVDFTKDNPGGLYLGSATEIDAISGISDSLKVFMKHTLHEYLAGMSDTDESCGEVSGAISLQRVYMQKYAIGGMGGGSEHCGSGGFAVLWADIDGRWREVAGTQNVGFSCSALERYKIPSAIAGSTCFTDDIEGGSRAYTQG